jgi:hypothetical protein
MSTTPGGITLYTTAPNEPLAHLAKLALGEELPIHTLTWHNLTLETAEKATL